MQTRVFWKYSTGIMAVIVLTSIFIGRYPTPFLMPFETLASDPIARQLVLNYRIPRIIGAILIGAGLSIAGVCTQTIFRNPLADSGVLGVSQAAAFGVIIGKLIAPREWILAVSIGFGFAALSLFIIGRLSMSKRNNQEVSTISIIIAGIAVSAVFSSGIGLAKYFADTQNQLPDIVFWLMGGLWQINWNALFVIAPIVLICTTWLLFYRFRLNALAMPNEVAFSLGIDKRKEINFVLALCVAIIAICVTYCGIISWVGLIVPNITRRLVGVNTMQLIPASALLGGTFLLVCDTISRSVLPGEIPVGILTALAGAIFLIYLLANGKNFNRNL